MNNLIPINKTDHDRIFHVENSYYSTGDRGTSHTHTRAQAGACTHTHTHTHISDDVWNHSGDLVPTVE